MLLTHAFQVLLPFAAYVYGQSSTVNCPSCPYTLYESDLENWSLNQTCYNSTTDLYTCVYKTYTREGYGLEVDNCGYNDQGKLASYDIGGVCPNNVTYESGEDDCSNQCYIYT